LPIFQFLCHNTPGRVSRLNIEPISENKKKKEILFEQMITLSDQKYYLLFSNSEQFEYKLREDEENLRRKEAVMEERKRVREKMEQEKYNKEFEQQKIHQEREAEEKAVKLLEFAQNLGDIIDKKSDDGEGRGKKKKK